MSSPTGICRLCCIEEACQAFRRRQEAQTTYTSRVESVMPDIDYQNLFCRVCFCGPEPELKEGGQLISPCRCAGSVRCIHLHCLRTWQATQRAQGRSQKSQSCELCGSRYVIPEKLLQKERRQSSHLERVQTGLKRLWQWCNDSAQGPLWQEALRYWRNALLVGLLA